MSTTKPSEREKQLEAERDDYQAKYEAAVGERDTATSERDAAAGERDDYQAKYEAADEARQQAEAQRDQLLDEVSKPSAPTTATASTEPADEQPAAQEPSEADTIKDLLKRNGLKKCWMLPTGPCFSEAHARQYAADEFDSLTVISAE